MKFDHLPRHLLLAITASALVIQSHSREMPKDMPREDVIDIPAIGEGLCVSQVFQSNMVVQRDKPISVWGWAEPGEQVTVSFAGKKETARAGRDRTWKVTLEALPADATPQVMTVKGKSKTLTLENILLGDVWILSGQSNMEFDLIRVENGPLEMVSANYPQIRILTVPFNEGAYEVKQGFARLWSWSDWSKRHFRKGDWDVCTPEIAKELSAIGYVFARRIHKASQVPIGVIDVSRGGTTVETWAPKERLGEMESAVTQAWLKKWEDDIASWDAKADLAERIQRKKGWLKRMEADGRKLSAEAQVIPSDLLLGPVADQNSPGYCYAGMIEPIKGLSVKGAIWHQGYNNALGGLNGAEMYRDVFPTMIKAWREDFNDPKLPFGVLSLCTEGYPQTLDNYCEAMLNHGIGIREAQYRTFADLYNAGDKNIGFVSTYDLRRRWFHPALKLPAGERIARWALATQYGFDERILSWKPPVITEMQVKDDSLVLSFDMPINDPEDGDIVGFAIAGKDRRFHPAKAEFVEIRRDKYDNKRLKLTSIMVSEPVAYRYGWGRNPLANLQASGHKDVPLATQRSDDWSDYPIPLGVLAEGMGTSQPLSRGDIGKLRLALREMDKQRRLAEAKAAVEELSAKK